MTDSAVSGHSEPEPFTGEPLALDLINTRPFLPDGRIDLLDDAQALRAWITLEADRLPHHLDADADVLTRLGPDDVAAVHTVRQHAEAAVDRARHGDPPPDGAIHGLNQAQWAAPSITELTWDGTTIMAGPARSGPFGAQLAGVLAESVTELLASPHVTRIRQCEADDCVMLFLPAHPRRRWCSATRCGNRVRVARHYQRHKQP